MNDSRVTAGRRLAGKSLLVTAVAGVMLTATAFAPAYAAPAPGTATGATTITLGGKAYNALQAGVCGPLVVTAANGVTASVTGKSGLKLIFPISGIETEPGNPDAVRIDHSGSVTLENTCYSIGLSTLRITDFGLSDQGSAFDLSAVTKSSDDSGRQVLGELDLTSGSLTVSGTGKVRVAQMNLLTSGAGAEELNELATGSETVGPFSGGMKIGFAKTRVVIG